MSLPDEDVDLPPARDREAERDLLVRLAAGDASVRDELITLHLPLVHHVARRFRDRGENYDDLVQVGTIGLINAIDRFEPERGLEFSTYATPTIIGEIKRHFRDRTGAVRVPRRIQELRGPMLAAREDLTNALQRTPTVREIAERLGVEPDEVLEVLEATAASFASPLDPVADESDAMSLGAILGEEDDGLQEVDDREALRPLLAQLPEREQRIIAMRFGQQLSQVEIAEQLGISQMHVSRLLAKALAQLRVGLTVD